MQNPLLIKNFVADAAIAAYRVVKIGAADGAVAQAAVVTDALIGVAGPLGAAAAGDRIDITVAGIADIEYGGAVSRGDLLTVDGQGRAVVATRHTHTENTNATYIQNATTAIANAGNRIIGVALKAGVLGDIGDVLLAPIWS